jgi:hypothetical protein
MCEAQEGGAGAPVILRAATFNVEDVRTTDLLDENQPRVRQIAEVIQRMRPTILLLNEIAYDMPGAPGFQEGAPAGQNATRFVNSFLIKPQNGAAPMRFQTVMLPVNTGVASGFDLNNDGKVSTTFTHPLKAPANGDVTELPDDARRYGEDSWGFGGFPGQYGMALLVDERLKVLREKIRTFQLLPWDYVSGAFIPTNPDGTPWFSPEELAVSRLSSKSHWDVPVELPNGTVLHILCSHPTPPTFDGPEKRNARRNHDEIRFWRDYIDNAPYIVDDKGEPYGLEFSDHFVILGDLNADPDEGSAFKNPISTQLLSCRRINAETTPTSPVVIDGLDPDDTAMFRLRVDYVLPSVAIDVKTSGVWRVNPAPIEGKEGVEGVEGRTGFPSDHFPVWADLVVPAP